jgi:hypothetical protein
VIGKIWNTIDGKRSVVVNKIHYDDRIYRKVVLETTTGHKSGAKRSEGRQ